jgi:hypothetical protein
VVESHAALGQKSRSNRGQLNFEMIGKGETMTDETEIETDEPVRLNQAYLKAKALQLTGDSATIVEILRRSSFRQIADQIHVLNPLPYGGYDDWIEVDSSGHNFGPRPEFPPTEADAMYRYPFADLTVKEYDRQVAEETALHAMEAEIEADLAILEARHQLAVDAIKARRHAT